MFTRFTKSLFHPVWFGIIVSLLITTAGITLSHSQTVKQTSTSSLRPPKNSTEAHARRLYEQYKQVNQQALRSQEIISAAEQRIRDERKGMREVAYGYESVGLINETGNAIAAQQQIIDRERNRLAQIEARQARLEEAWNKNGFAVRYSPLNYAKQTEYNPMTKSTQDKIEKAIWFNQQYRGEGAPAKGAAPKSAARKPSQPATKPQVQPSDISARPSHSTGTLPQSGQHSIGGGSPRGQAETQSTNVAPSARQGSKRPPANTAGQKTPPASGTSSSSKAQTSQGKHSMSLTPAE